MRDADTLVFVEVRYRRNQRYGGALESIDGRKQYRLHNAAAHYLQRRWPGPAPACRFDVVLVSGDLQGDRPQLEWIKSAF